MSLDLLHLGWSGLRLVHVGATLDVDPPEPGRAPAVVTWTEAERVRGARRALGPVAAAPEVLRWLDLDGIRLEGEVSIGGFTVRALPYAPIPYATPMEALRKTRSAVLRPGRAFHRLAHTFGRPEVPPLTLSIRVGELRIAYLAQALHRFVGELELERLRRAYAGADVLVAGTDFDDEEATGRLMGRFEARTTVLFDAIGPVRRLLGLPMRPPSVCLAHAPAGTLLLAEAGRLRIEESRGA